MNKLFLMSIMITSLNVWASNGPCQLNQKLLNQSCELSDTTGTNPCQNIANNFSCLNCDLSNINASQLSSAIQQAITNYQTIHGQGSIVTINLTGSNMSGAYLPGVDLSKLNLNSVNLAGSCLQNGNLAGVQAPSATFTGADLSGANFTNANLTGAVIGGTYNNTNNNPTNLNNTNFTGATLTNIAQGEIMASSSAATNKTQNLALSSTANWQTANFSKATLSGVDLTGIVANNLTLLNGTNLQNANLNNNNFANIDFTKYSNITFSGGMFNNVSFTGCSLAGLNLTGADFHGSTFTNTNMTGTNLSSPPSSNAGVFSIVTNFDGCTFNNVNLTGANLTGTNFSASYTPTFLINNSGGATINRTPATLTNVTLTNANLSYANFSGTTLSGVIFTPESNNMIPAPNTQLSNNFTGTIFNNATFSNTQGLISILASYNGSVPPTFNGAQLGVLNFNAGPNVTLDLTHCNFDGAIFGNWVSSGAITSTIGGESVNGTLFPIKLPFITNATFNNVEFENLSADLSSTNSTFNNCNFINGLAGLQLVFNNGYKGDPNSPFTINHGSNNLYVNCSFKGLTFNNSPNPKNSSVVGMQNAQFAGSLEIAGCYFQNTDFTGIEFSNSSGSEKANFSTFNISNSSFTSLLNSSTGFAPSSFFHQITTNKAANSSVLTDWTHITFKCVTFRNINPTNQTQTYQIQNPYLGHCMA